MYGRSNGRLVVLAVLLLSNQLACHSQALSKGRAIETAQAYCRAVGVTVDAAPDAKYMDKSLLHHGPEWTVAFGTDLHVEVADDSGLVIGLMDQRVSAALGSAAVGTAIPEEAAISRATALVRATGCRDDLAFAGAKRMVHTALAAHHVWAVRWTRLWNGIPYQNGGVNVLLQAETGAVIAVGVAFYSPPTDSVVVTLPAEDAARTALAQIGGPVPVGAYPAALVTQVVRPNTFHMPGGSMKPLPGPSRVAWVGQFQAGDQTYEVYVDAETGKVIGGQRWGPRGGARSEFPALAKWFQDVKEFRLYRRRKDGSWPPTPLAVISEKSNSAAYEALKPGGPPAGLPKRFGEYKLTIMRGDESPLDLSYEEKSGVLGLGPKWMKAPKQLTALLAKLGGATK
jgi:hypothetical protein